MNFGEVEGREHLSFCQKTCEVANVYDDIRGEFNGSADSLACSLLSSSTPRLIKKSCPMRVNHFFGRCLQSRSFETMEAKRVKFTRGC